MSPTEQLIQEHTAIGVMLGILDKACARIEAGEGISIADLRRMLEFLKVFADGCHHAKEEGYLFPALERAGIPREHGPIGVMLSEHDLARNHVLRMENSLNALANGEKQAQAEFVQHARSYAHLLAMHIEKENRVLFPMADERLSPDVQASLIEDFERLEVEKIGAGKHEEFHRMLRELKDAYMK